MTILTEGSDRPPGEWYLARQAHSRLLPSYPSPSVCTIVEVLCRLPDRALCA